MNTNWPPAYTIRNSNRAKQVILQISPKKGLVVIVPAQRRHPKIEELLQQKRQWIQKNLSHLQMNQERLAPTFMAPSLLHLYAIDKTVRFDYQQTEHKFFKITPTMSLLSDSELSYLVSGPIGQSLLLIKTLKRLLKQIAQTYLTPWLESLSLEIQFPFQSVSIRSQSTLWGSCTASKKISLNVKLLFLPRILTRYVLLHELCHTQYLNHSKRYWNLLKRFDPDCLTHRKLLRRAGQYLPHWIEDSE